MLMPVAGRLLRPLWRWQRLPLLNLEVRLLLRLLWRKRRLPLMKLISVLLLRLFWQELNLSKVVAGLLLGRSGGSFDCVC